MIKEIEYNRKEIFEHYNKCDNPFVILTTKIEITNIVKYCKQNKNFYATMGYVITKTVNEIDNFKYRYQNNKFYYCDRIKSNYTQMYEDGNIGYFTLKDKENYKDYIKEFIETQNKFLEDKQYKTENDMDEIWLSCSPWFTFSSLIPPFNKEITIPQFIWDKYQKEEDKYYINLMILVHHGFADGSHIGKFINKLEENIKKFED